MVSYRYLHLCYLPLVGGGRGRDMAKLTVKVADNLLKPLGVTSMVYIKVKLSG